MLSNKNIVGSYQFISLRTQNGLRKFFDSRFEKIYGPLKPTPVQEAWFENEIFANFILFSLQVGIGGEPPNVPLLAGTRLPYRSYSFTC